ncbi:MAG: GGDEF domain-containing protein [Pseudomonadales bacterium]
MELRRNSFASASLEQEYQAELASEKIRLTRIVVVLAALLNLAFVVLDLWAIPSSLLEVWGLRAVIILALGCLFLSTWLPRFAAWYPVITALAFLAMGAAISAMIWIAAPTELAARVYYGGLVLVIIGLHTMTYLNTAVAAAVSLTIALMYAAIGFDERRVADGGSVIETIAHLFFFGSTIIIGIVGQSLRDGYARENYLLRHSLKRDVEIKEMEKQRASYLAEHDPLTGLANRLQLERSLGALLTRAAEADRRVAVMFLDLDDFKPVNDTHGHAVGDRVLKVLAERLQRCVLAGDLVARVGGDEFVIGMLADDAAEAAIARSAAQVAAAVGEGIELRGTTLHLTASIGVAAFPDDGADIDTLLRAADQEMYRVKNAGKGGTSLTRACGASSRAA